MSNVTISPNMGLPVPVVGQEPGPQWAADVNSSFNVVDQHNHTVGQGVLVPVAGLNINADLPLNVNNLISARTVRFSPQISTFTPLSTDLNCLYVEGIDLYYRDGAGDTPIQITKNGSVNATTSGIVSGTASASFSGGVLVVDSASLTPGNIQGGSILLGNNIASSPFLTLSPPSLSGSYTLYLPTIPVSSPAFLTIDTVGNITPSTPYPLTAAGMANNTITASQIANATITSTQIALSTITNANLATPNVVVSAGTGAGGFSSAANSPVFVSPLSTVITCHGQPIMINLQSDNSGDTYWDPGFLKSGAYAINGVYVLLYRDGVQIASYNVNASGSTLTNIDIPFYGFHYIDAYASGTAASPVAHTYAIYAYVPGSFSVFNCRGFELLAVEL